MNRITLNPDQCARRPYIRGMWIRVADVLDLFASGISFEEMPDPEAEDIITGLKFTTGKIDHLIITT